MRREEKRRKFNEAVLNTFYPPPSPPPKDEDVPLSIIRQDFAELESDDDDGEGESETQELTRAQRKRIRKKKLKEDASRRKQIIGPLLPLTVGDGQTGTPDVRRNAYEKPSEQPPQPAGCSNQTNKVKQRRKAKKLAREREQH